MERADMPLELRWEVGELRPIHLRPLISVLCEDLRGSLKGHLNLLVMSRIMAR